MIENVTKYSCRKCNKSYTFKSNLLKHENCCNHFTLNQYNCYGH